MKEDEEFAAKVQEIVDEDLDEDEVVLRERGRSKSDACLIFRLKKKRPDPYGDSVTVKGDKDKPLMNNIPDAFKETL